MNSLLETGFHCKKTFSRNVSQWGETNAFHINRINEHLLRNDSMLMRLYSNMHFTVTMNHSIHLTPVYVLLPIAALISMHISNKQPGR